MTVPAGTQTTCVRSLAGVRTAIVHDWFQGYHGSERVVDAMRLLFPPDEPPDVFTFHAAKDVLPSDLAEAIVQQSRLAALPGIRQRGHEAGRWRLLLPYMPTYFRRLPLDAYDLVISSSHAFAVNARPRADAVHLCYCYTPIRYAWMREVEAERVRGPKGAALRAMSGYLRRQDLAASRRPDSYVAISSAVADRIRRFYGRDAVVIHPPVDLEDLDPRQEKERGHFVWVHRLVSYKHPLLVAEAFRGLPYRLTMVGVGPLEGALRARLPENVELLGWLPRSELAALYARSSGFIHVGEEDFGISTVEALASGTPVVALARGGARDIVRDGVDGVLIEAPDVVLLREALHALAEQDWSPTALAARARGFSRARFLARLGDHLDELMAVRGAPRAAVNG
jgi:glycosyltransferase involved in cell wall biosynthesis